MSQVTGDFSQGNIRSIILKLGIPIVAAEFVHIFYNLVDRMYIGHMPGTGTAALTGVGIVFPLITFINSFAELFGVGGAPLSAIARGEKDNEKAERIMETSFSALVLIGTLLTLVLLCFAPLLVRLMGGEKEAGVHALAYFRVYALGTVPVLLCLGMNPFINSLGFSRTGMLTVVIGAVLNTILDPILIYAFHLGVTGAAIATVISQTISAGWVILFLTSSRPPLKIRRLHISLSCLKPIMKLGITGFTFKTTTSITQAVVNLTLRKWGGVLSMFFVSAASIINSLREVINLPVLGMTQGAEAVMSFNYGAKKYDRVLDTIRFIFSLSLSVNTAIWGLLMIFPQIFISIFTSDGQAFVLRNLSVHGHADDGPAYLCRPESSPKGTPLFHVPKGDPRGSADSVSAVYRPRGLRCFCGRDALAAHRRQRMLCDDDPDRGAGAEKKSDLELSVILNDNEVHCEKREKNTENRNGVV